jgi:hypothetical protein
VPAVRSDRTVGSVESGQVSRCPRCRAEADRGTKATTGGNVIRDASFYPDKLTSTADFEDLDSPPSRCRATEGTLLRVRPKQPRVAHSEAGWRRRTHPSSRVTAREMRCTTSLSARSSRYPQVFHRAGLLAPRGNRQCTRVHVWPGMPTWCISKWRSCPLGSWASVRSRDRN